MIQGKVIRFLELKKESLGRLGVGLIELAFKCNPTMMVSNQNYLNLFFNYSKKSAESQNVFINEVDYYNYRAKFYELLSHYLDEKYYGTAHQIPDYDLICLDNILDTEYTEKEFLDSKIIIEILKNRKNPELEYKVKFFKQILNIIAKSSSKRCTLENNLKLRKLFPLEDLRIMLETLSDEYQLKTNIFRLFRNIYIFHIDNIFDDEKKIYELVNPMNQQQNKSKSSSPQKTKKDKESYNIDFSKISDKLKDSKGEGEKRKTTFKAEVNNKELDKLGPNEENLILEIIRDLLVKFIEDAQKNVLSTPKEKKIFSSFGVTMLMSTLNYKAKEEVQKRFLTTRRSNVIQNENHAPPGNEPTEIYKLMFNILEHLKKKEVKESFKRVFSLPESDNEEIDKVQLFHEIELEPFPEKVRKEIKKLNKIVSWCEYYSSGKDKESYKIYNLGASTDVVKRFSNKLEDRQSSVRLPLEILKSLFLEMKENANYESFGIIIGALYVSYKL